MRGFPSNAAFHPESLQVGGGPGLPGRLTARFRGPDRGVFPIEC